MVLIEQADFPVILKDSDGRQADLADLMRLRETALEKDRKNIDRQIKSIEIGVAGERSAAHFLNREFGQSRRIGILHDVRLCVDGEVAQIDHLLIHRVQQAAWVLETKNFSGRMVCDEHGDWTVWNGGKPIAIASPVNQARRQAILLKAWLDAHSIATIRKIEPVVLISPRSSINRKHLGPGEHVVKSDNFGSWWNTQTEKIGVTSLFGMVGRHIVNGMSEADLVDLGRQLSEAHSPLSRDWRATLRLSESVGSSEIHPVSGSHDDGHRVIETRLGAITITRLSDGRFTLRNDPNEALIDVVRTSCRGLARWNPRFRNWVFAEENRQAILSKLASKLPTE